MSFPIVAVRTPQHAPDELFPLVAPAEADLSVVLHADDTGPMALTAREISVRTQFEGRVRDLVAVRRRGVEVVITDARVIVTCERAVRGSVLAGHVKYPWLVAVGGSDRRGRFDDAELRMIVQRSAGDYAVLTIGFEPAVDVNGLARDIARRAAALWLETQSDGVDESTPLWQALATAERLEGEQGEFALHWMPEHIRVDSLSRPAVRSDVPPGDA
jgi:hypothetical protein